MHQSFNETVSGVGVCGSDAGRDMTRDYVICTQGGGCYYNVSMGWVLSLKEASRFTKEAALSVAKRLRAEHTLNLPGIYHPATECRVKKVVAKKKQKAAK